MRAHGFSARRTARLCPHGRSQRQAQRAPPVLRAMDPGAVPERPRLRVRLAVQYEVTRRQMLCVGGDKLPFGWSFMSIAHVPMTWNPGHLWTVEVDLQAGERIQYKYVILEEQEWTKLENPSAQGVVFNHRNGSEADPPPDNDTIQMKMAIVSWQPGPNRIIQLPTEEELEEVRPGQEVQRDPARPRTDFTEVDGRRVQLPDVSQGTTETLSLRPVDGGTVDEFFVDRRDVWAAPGWDRDPLLFRRP